MPNKILIITSYFAPAYSYGGPPKVLYLLAKELVRCGKKVTVLTTDVLDENRNPKLSEIIDGVEVVRFRSISNLLAYKAKIFFVSKLLNRAKKYIDENDVVLFSDLRTIVNWQLYSYVWRKKIPYGIFPFGQVPLGSGIQAPVKKVFDFWWVNDFVKKASWCFYQTEHEREQLMSCFRLLAKDIHFLPLPVEKKSFNIDKQTLSNFRKKWGIQLNDQVLLFVGRLHYLKGIDILIKTVEPLLRVNNQLKLMIVGRDDGEEHNLKRNISPDINKQIIFTGPLYNKEAAKAYLISKCFVFTPRFYEETSTASLEAMSWGIPVVVTKQAEIPFLRDYKAGFIVENDSDQISCAIKKIISALPDEKEIMSKEAIRCIKDHFLAEKVAGLLLQIIRKTQMV